MVMKAYSAEFKADAVALYLSDPSHTFDGIGNDLGVSRETLRNWVRAEHKRTGTSTTELRTSRPAPREGEVSSDSVLEEENRQLKAQIRKLETEREILRRAAKYFAGETNW
ncbi:putative transposase orfA for insertion sequence element [Rhodococcus pyridinivorans AK37]|uniref:Putative transposase orfA for insertion sequence element n=1 Tax=Rhodococcus pyridinivorans AK37 TaxID=1114960 RepID=H0JT45_9NOCA|nr:putative transposase orfA for insertion sequence element [Rhodococcus pyridinivorans AK37]